MDDLPLQPQGWITNLYRSRTIVGVDIVNNGVVLLPIANTVLFHWNYVLLSLAKNSGKDKYGELKLEKKINWPNFLKFLSKSPNLYYGLISLVKFI